MSTSVLSILGRGLRGAWRLLDATRRALLNLLLLGLLLAGAWALLRSAAPALHDKTALVLDIGGALVEQRTGLSLRDQVLGQAQGQPQRQTRRRDVVTVLEAAARDEKIGHALESWRDGQPRSGAP